MPTDSPAAKPATALLGLLLLHAAVPAQERAASRPQRFTLVAGEHDLTALVELTAQVRKKRIGCDEAVTRAFADADLVLQRELRLDGPAFEDVATSLLFYRGYLVVPADRVDEDRVIAMTNTMDLRDAAVTRTPEAILSRPARLEYVTTVAKAAQDGPPASMQVMLLRPFFGFDRHPWSLRIEECPEGIRLTGSTEQVAFALRTLEFSSGQPPTAMPAIGWHASGSLPWPGGTLSVAAFLRLFSDTLDANVLDGDGSGQGTTDELDLGSADSLAPHDWFARATRVLHALGRVMVPVAPEQRVFLLRSLQRPRSREIVWRASFEAADLVDKSSTVVPVVTSFDLLHVRCVEAANRLRPRLAAGKSVTFATLSESRLLLAGLRDDVVAIVEAIREFDVPVK